MTVWESGTECDSKSINIIPKERERERGKQEHVTHITLLVSISESGNPLLKQWKDRKHTQKPHF
jgi:hypothetical protein